jgi:hypothetical protein
MKKNLLPIILYFSLFFTLSALFTAKVRAADLEITEPLPGISHVQVEDPVTIPNEDLTVSGYGEPGAEITLSSEKERNIIYQTKTMVDERGKWQTSIPSFGNDLPDQLIITSTIALTTAEVIETVTVTGTAAATGAVVFHMVLDRLFRVLQVIGLLGKRTTRGYVFDHATRKPVSFATLRIESVQDGTKDLSKPTISETVVSTVEGFFRIIDLPSGKYRIWVSHPDYEFPVQTPRPWYTNPLEFYQGEEVTLTKQQSLDLLFIPMEPVANAKHGISHWLELRVLGSVISHYLHQLSLPMGVISCALTLIYPSFVNFAIATIYIVFALYEYSKTTKKVALSGIVVDEKGKPLDGTVVKIIQSPPEELAGVLLTHKDGRFSMKVMKAQYRIVVSKNGYVPDEKDGMSFEMLEVKKAKKNLQYRLKEAGEFDFTAQPLELTDFSKESNLK